MDELTKMLMAHYGLDAQTAAKMAAGVTGSAPSPDPIEEKGQTRQAGPFTRQADINQTVREGILTAQPYSQPDVMTQAADAINGRKRQEEMLAKRDHLLQAMQLLRRDRMLEARHKVANEKK